MVGMTWFFVNRTSKWLLPLLYVCIGVVIPTCAQDAPPTPPPSVIQVAVHAATVAGYTPVVPPSFSQTSLAEHTGNPLWRLDFGANAIGVQVAVDENLGRVVEYQDDVATSQAGKSFRTGAYPSVSMATATSNVLQIMHNLPVDSPDSWQITKQESSNYTGSNGNPGRPYYLIVASKSGSFGLDKFLAFVEPYTGKITHWFYEDGAVFPDHGPIISADNARQVAVGAYLAYLGDDIQNSDPRSPTADSTETYWNWVNSYTPLCRLTYSFGFELAKVADPNSDDPSETAYHGRGHMHLVFIVDAVTGELVGVGNPIGSGAQPRGSFSNSFSARTQMISALSREHPLTPLALAVASSLPVSVASAASAVSVPPAKASRVGAKARSVNRLPVVDSLTPAAPSGATVRFSHRVGKQDVAFALDVKANRLSWQVPPVASQAGQVSADAKPASAVTKAEATKTKATAAAAATGQWNTVALLKTQTAALKAWLEKPTSASANASAAAGTAKKEGATVPAVAVGGKP